MHRFSSGRGPIGDEACRGLRIEAYFCLGDLRYDGGFAGRWELNQRGLTDGGAESPGR